MCFGGAAMSNLASVQGARGLSGGVVALARMFGGAGSGAPPTATPAAGVTASPSVPRIADTPDEIRRRSDQSRMTLGASPATPQQSLRATLGGV